MLFTVKYYLTACEKYRVLSLYFEEHSERNLLGILSEGRQNTKIRNGVCRTWF